MIIDWTYADIAAFGREPHVARHRLHESPLFDDAGLAALLDRIPRDIVHPYTMGEDPARTHEWARGATTTLPGAELVEVVRRGRLWLNLVGVGDHDAEIGDLVRQAYADLGDVVPGFHPLHIKATLLVSSPGAQVYYHADNQPNLLWHLRGQKRAYVYPLAPRYLAEEDLERLVAGATDEQLPYDPGFDEQAAVLDLVPGDVAWWPQNSPHRVTNTADLNVSLSTEHRTAVSTRREHVWAANYFLRAHGYRPRSSREVGALSRSKVALMRAGRRSRVLSVPEVQAPRPSFRVDPDAPLGHSPLR